MSTHKYHICLELITKKVLISAMDWKADYNREKELKRSLQRYKVVAIVQAVLLLSCFAFITWDVLADRLFLHHGGNNKVNVFGT